MPLPSSAHAESSAIAQPAEENTSILVWSADVLHGGLSPAGGWGSPLARFAWRLSRKEKDSFRAMQARCKNQQGSFLRIASGRYQSISLLHPMFSSACRSVERREWLLQVSRRKDDLLDFQQQRCAWIEQEMGSISAKYADCMEDIVLTHVRWDPLDVVEAREAVRRLLILSKSFRQAEEDSKWDRLAGPRLSAFFMGKNGYLEHATDIMNDVLKIRSIQHGADSISYAQGLLDLAYIYFVDYQFDDARPLLLLAISKADEAVGRYNSVSEHAYFYLARMYFVQGELTLAEKNFLRSGEISTGLGHSKLGAQKQLAEIYRLQGMNRRSFRLYRQILSAVEKNSGLNSPGLLDSLYGMVRIYTDEGDYDEAEALIRRAKEITERNFDQLSLTYGEGLLFRALLHDSKGEYDESARLIAQAIPILEANREDYEMVHALEHLGWWHLQEGSYAEAHRLLEKALEIHDRLEIRAPSAALVGLAAVHELRGDHDVALEKQKQYEERVEHGLSRALAVRDDLRRLSLTSSFNETLSLHLHAAPEDRDTAELALTTTLRRKARIQELGAHSQAMIRRRLPEEYRYLLDELAALEAEYSSLARRPLEFDTEGVRLMKLEEILGQQDHLLGELGRLHRGIAGSGPVQIADVQQNLPPDSVLVEYVRYSRTYSGPERLASKPYEDHYSAYIVFPDDFQWVVLGPAKSIDSQISKFREDTMRILDTSISGRALYAMVMEPVLARTRGRRRLFMAPDAELYLVPFGALTDDDGRYVVENTSIHYLASGRDLQRWATRVPTVPGQVVAVVNPHGAGLKQAETEAEVLKHLFGDVRVLRGEMATEAQVRGVVRPWVFHLATHGLFDSGRTELERPVAANTRWMNPSHGMGPTPTWNPERVETDNPMLNSGLLLAANDREISSDDGWWTAYEISGRDLEETELVTLSACDTGRGELHHGEGVLGLRRAFVLAGAQTIVMSLWSVDDQSTAKLMTSYYDGLRRGVGRGDAMRQAQLEMLSRDGFNHPFYWAGFVVEGDWHPLMADAGAPPRMACQARVDASGKTRLFEVLVLMMLILRRRIGA